MDKKKKRRIIITVVVVLLLLIFPLIVRDGMKRNALPELTFGDDKGKNDNSKADSAVIDYVGGFTAVEGVYPQNLSFHNSPTNKCKFVVRMYLSDGTLVYETGAIEPGGKEVVNRLFTKLEKGTYENVLLCYDCFDETMNPVGRCEFTIKIRSV